MKKSFMIHVDSLDVLDDLTKEQAAELFFAIKNFHNGKEEKLSPIVKVAFSSFKNQFIRENEKYEETCKTRAKAGSLGGKQKVANASKCKQKVAKVADSDSDSDSKKEKKKYLEFVFLLEEEFLKLKENIPAEEVEELIEQLNNYLGSTGKKYKSHYHTILTWQRKREKEQLKGNIKYPVFKN